MEVNDELGALEQGLRVLIRDWSGRTHRGDLVPLVGGPDREKLLSRT